MRDRFSRDWFGCLLLGSLLVHGSVLAYYNYAPPRLLPLHEVHYVIALQAATQQTQVTEAELAEVPDLEMPLPEIPDVLTAVPEEPLRPSVPPPPEETPPEPPPPEPQNKMPAPAEATISGSAVLAAPSMIYNPRPPYPPELLAAGREGTPVLEVRVGADGKVEAVRLLRSSGYTAMDESALNTVRTWRFQPARRGGVAVPVTLEVPLRFYIRNR